MTGMFLFYTVRKGRLHCVVLGSGKGFYLDFTRATLSVLRESRQTAILFGTKTAAGCGGGRARLVGRFCSILRRHLRSDRARKPRLGKESVAAKLLLLRCQKKCCESEDFQALFFATIPTLFFWRILCHFPPFARCIYFAQFLPRFNFRLFSHPPLPPPPSLGRRGAPQKATGRKRESGLSRFALGMSPSHPIETLPPALLQL